MSKKRDRRGYEPPWGVPQPLEEFERIHWRWIGKLQEASGRDSARPPWREDDKDYDNGQLLQCGGCSYYVPLEGGLGADWGVCTNPSSKHDRKCVFEHFGCLMHSTKPEKAKEAE